jgi:Phage integrase family
VIDTSSSRAVVVWSEQAPAVESPAASFVRNGRVLADLIDAYQTDHLSRFHKLRFSVRKNHAALLKRIRDRHGATPIASITGRTLVEWHAQWQGGDKVSMAHAFISQIRTISGFGFTMLSDPHCKDLSHMLRDASLRFEMAPPRVDRLTFEQVEAVRHWAHQIGFHSIALAQAIQFELMIRQKDVIGEWIPQSEPGDAIIHWRGQKWLRGIKWSEIDDDFILRHVTSKRQKPIVVDLKNAPMVMEELEYFDEIPEQDEPLVMCEATCMPYSAAEFRRKWRIVANYAGIPKNVRNMDSRSGAITESFEAGVSGEQIQKAATHSDIKMTQRYNRGDFLANSNDVAAKRVASRKKSEGDTVVAAERVGAAS